jgi:MFS family permease
VVACFPLVSSASEVWLVYVLTVLQMGVGAFFEPAEAAAIGSVVEPGEVVTATALQATTWSVMLGFGAMTGGFLTAAFGRTASFLVDAASYLASALLILGARVPSLPPGEARVGWRAWTGADDFRAGLRLVARQPGLKRLVWVKSGWALAGGAAILLYAVLGEREFQVAGSAEAGIGLLLGMRGVGALLGPLVARRVGGDEPRFLERAIGLGYLVTAVAWLGFAASPTWWLAAAFLAAAHTGASVQWSFSSALITLSVEDRFRGRAFSLDMMAQLVLLAASSSLGGWLLDQGAVSPRWLMAGCSAVLLAAGAAWAYGSGPEKTPSQASPGGVPR